MRGTPPVFGAEEFWAGEGNGAMVSIAAIKAIAAIKFVWGILTEFFLLGSRVAWTTNACTFPLAYYTPDSSRLRQTGFETAHGSARVLYC
jgi:hypothetical protein